MSYLITHIAFHCIKSIALDFIASSAIDFLCIYICIKNVTTQIFCRIGSQKDMSNAQLLNCVISFNLVYY